MAYRPSTETGLLSFEGESWFALFAPAGTPGRVVRTCAARSPRSPAMPSLPAGWSATAAGAGDPAERHIQFLQKEMSAGRVS